MLKDAKTAELLEETDFYDLGQTLIEEALGAGGNDNITVVLMQIEEEKADG